MAYKTKPKKLSSKRSFKTLPIIKTFFSIWKWFTKSIWHKILLGFLITVVVCLAIMYGIARWYIYTQENVPYDMGVSFVPEYAQSLGLNPIDTLSAIFQDLKIKNIRFTSYWSTIEDTKGTYNFSELDQEFAMADQYHVKVNLSIGLRQPRWPECHIPTWATSEPYSVWDPQLNAFITAVVNRYKGNPELSTYELENEYFLKAFGTCTNYSRQRLVNEFNMVKKLDPNHQVLVNRSNNALGTPLGQPTPDIFGVSVYKRVYDQTITHRYFEYPFPAWFYAFLAGTEKIITGKNTELTELQAEPWPPTFMTAASEKEQLKSMDPARLINRFQYGKATGMKTIDLWGVEWWYYQKVIKHDPTFWNIAENEFAQTY